MVQGSVQNWPLMLEKSFFMDTITHHIKLINANAQRDNLAYSQFPIN